MTSASNKLAGGGVTEYLDPSSLIVEKFEPAVLQGLQEAYKELKPKDVPLDAFLQQMASEDSSATGPASEQNLDLPLSNYFISSSHNTYLTGHQLYGKANVAGYKNVLLRGCRSVEVDVWDGEPPSSSDSSSDEEPPPPTSGLAKPKRWTSSERVEPVVLHGYTATKDVSFRRVCETIRDNAFITSTLPVVVSLEVHTSHEQQELMVEIMEETFKGRLVDASSATDQQLPSPRVLEGKILIKVKYSPPDAVKEAPAANLNKVTSESSYRSEDDEPQDQKQGKPRKIIEALSNMGVFMRSYHFKSFTQPEAAVPSHIFSLSEGALSEVHKNDPRGLFDHNKNFLMRAYPRGTRISSSNLDPAPFWRCGVQMVALNWQKIDKGIMLNEAMFANTGGWVLKPPGHRSSAAYSGSNGGHGSTFSVTFIAGQNIQPPEDVEAKDLKPYVKCELHVELPNEWDKIMSDKKEKAKDKFRESIKAGKTSHPDFKSQQVKFDHLPTVIPELCFAKFKVKHDKFMNDPTIGWSCIRLDRLKPGYRFIHLFDTNGVMTKGVILAKFDFSWQHRDLPRANDAIKLPLR